MHMQVAKQYLTLLSPGRRDGRNTTGLFRYYIGWQSTALNDAPVLGFATAKQEECDD